MGFSWKAKRGMKPGEEGGMEPSTFLRWRLRRRTQNPKARAAAAMRPRGTPRPMPTFCPFVKPGAFSTDGLAAKLGVVEDEGFPVGEAESVDATAPISVHWVDIVVAEAEPVLCEEVDAEESTAVVSGMLELTS
jgi:hypothetical protein